MPRRTLLLTRQTHFGNDNRRVTVLRMPRQIPMEQHRHEFFEIAVVLSGAALHVTGNTRDRIGEGDVLFLNPSQVHGYEETRDLNLLNILVGADALERIGRELGDRPGYHALFSFGPARREEGFRRRLRLPAADLAQIDEWAARIEEEAGRPGARTGLLEEAYLTLMVDVLSRKYGQSMRRNSTKTNGAQVPLRLQARLGRVLSWIEIHLAEPFGVADLAALAGTSPRAFYRAFRSAMGVTPHAYVIRTRLGRAARRLAEASSEETITETADACGFADSNYFARAFHAYSGFSPREYRKRRGLPA